MLKKRYSYSAILNTNIISALNLNSHETADETLPTEDTPSSSENQLEDPGDVSDTPSSSGNQLEDPGDVSFNPNGMIREEFCHISVVLPPEEFVLYFIILLY